MLGEHKWKKDDVSLVIITKQSITFTSQFVDRYKISGYLHSIIDISGGKCES